MNVAVVAAREAGKCITQSIDQLDQVQVEQKNRLELVSEIDVIAEKLIIAELDRGYPEFNIVGEECGDLGRDSEYCWIIDPIDGTHNFLHGHPHCAVSIALKYKNEVTVAVIFDAIRNELFTARKGRGAQLDGRRMRVSTVTKLSQSLLCTGFPYRDAKDTKAWLKSFAHILPRAQGIHRTGSSVLDFAYVAAGRYDGFWEFGMSEWDIAAGSLMVREAGGLVTDMSGNTDVFKSGDAIAGNPRIHEKLSYLIENL
ncbi:UNVERIFIED_CONTAM: hypothetical protein GTU68_056082 [Idotea baltica]|nr:hypothetical protein [Idotea baltica]